MGQRREISGNTVLLFIDPDNGTNYDLIVCLTSNSLDLTTNQIDASSKCGPSILPGTQTFTAPFEFHDVWDTNNGEISAAALFALLVSKATFSWKFGPAIPAAGDNTYTGHGFLATLNINAAQNTPVSGTGTVAIQGIPVLTVTGS